MIRRVIECGIEYYCCSNGGKKIAEEARSSHLVIGLLKFSGRAEGSQQGAVVNAILKISNLSSALVS